MKRYASITGPAAVLAVLFFITTAVASSVPAGKQTRLGLYLTAKEAFEKWHVDRDRVHVLDVRTQEEYIFVGHAPMARNIPVMIFNQKLTTQRRQMVMEMNPEFLKTVDRFYNPEDIILVMCRSGGRSARAVDLLAGAGFKNVYNILDGFEGDSVTDPDSYFVGKRVKNGWKNSGTPWTYETDSELMYRP